MEHAFISLPAASLSPFGPSPALDRAVIASALCANPEAGSALALAANAILYFRQHRKELLAFAEIVTDLADLIDGDPDFEDATDVEDDFAVSPQATYFTGGPGCIVAEEDAGAYVEWTTKPSNSKRNGGAEILAGHEDDEEDDPGEEDDHSGQCDEDGVNTCQGWVQYTPGARGAGCMISDTGIGDTGGFYD